MTAGPRNLPWLRARIARLAGSSFATGALAISGGILLAQGISFLGNLILARLYLPESQDVQAGFVALATTLIPIATLRYDVGIVMPEDERSAHHLFRLSLVLGLVAAAVSLLAVPLCRVFGWGGAALIWMPLVLLSQSVTTSVIGCCNRSHLFGMQTTSKVVQALFFPLLAAAAFLWRGANPMNLPAAYSLASLLGAAIILRALRGAGKCPPLRPNRFVLSELVDVAHRYRLLPLVNLPMYVVNMASLAVLVWGMQSFSAGTSACFMMVLQILRVPGVLLGMALGQVFTARAARLVASPAALRRLTFKTMAGLVALALPLAMVFWLAGPWLFTLVFGEPWRQAGEFSRWLGWGAMAGVVSTPFAMLPTLLHSNVGQLLLTVAIGIGRCLLTWLAVRAGSSDLIVIGSTILDVAAVAAFIGYLAWMLARRSRAMVPDPASPGNPDAGAN